MSLAAVRAPPWCPVFSVPRGSISATLGCHCSAEQSELLLEVYWLVIHERLLFPRTREFHQRVS